MLSSRVDEIGFSPTLATSDLARKMRAEGIDVLDFSAGQPDFPTPDPVKAAGREAIDANRTGYTATPGVEELRAAIAARYERERGLRYGTNQVLVSPGAKASLYLACQALLGPGDEAIVPSPYWTSYPEQIKLAGATPVFADCPASEGFRLTVDRLQAAATPRTRLLMLNTPSNPTGACYSAEQLAPIAEWCVERGVWILADEIYCKLIYEGGPFASVASSSAGAFERTILIDGVSKTYSMTGWRIGYAAGPREVISAMAKIQSHSMSNATSISQWASVAALEMSDEELAPRVVEFRERRDELLRGIEELPGWSCAVPGGAFYLFPDVSGAFGTRKGVTIENGGDMARYLLEKARVAVVPGEAFGAPNHVRVSYALAIDRVREGLRRIADAMRELGV